MNERGPKITISGDDLAAEPPASAVPEPAPDRIVLVPVPVSADPAAEEEVICLPEAGQPAAPSLVPLVLLSFVPFINAWCWARLARRQPEAARVGWVMALFLGALSLLLTAAVGYLLFGNREPPAESAGLSVPPGWQDGRDDPPAARAAGPDPTWHGPQGSGPETASPTMPGRPAGAPAGADPGDWLERLAERLGRSVVVVRSRSGTGTGFVVASDGERHLVLTNRHVLARGPRRLDEVRLGDPYHVLLRDGNEYPAAVVGLPRADDLDLALLGARVPGLAPLGAVAGFDEVRQGERVAAVGHPLGLDFTITDGIVSAKREGLYIQTTAQINPGNSGGPLVSARGKVLGVCTLLLEPRDGQGISLALRADPVRDARAWRLRDGEAERLLARIPR